MPESRMHGRARRFHRLFATGLRPRRPLPDVPKKPWTSRFGVIGTAAGVNAVVRPEFATGETERKAVQLIIATPAFRELAETFVRFAYKLEIARADKVERPMN